MLKRLLNIFVTASLVFLLMLNGVAHEFVHSFLGHEDTIDHVINNGKRGQANFEKQHHHCDFLNLPTPVFLTSHYYISFASFLIHKDAFQLKSIDLCSRQSLHTALRGPPLFI